MQVTDLLALAASFVTQLIGCLSYTCFDVLSRNQTSVVWWGFHQHHFVIAVVLVDIYDISGESKRIERSEKYSQVVVLQAICLFT